ncbi:MAG: hypothetical protein IJ704_01365 [Bacilli bacterium]|nr:hypothetical protein [Bacilli bacterium]
MKKEDEIITSNLENNRIDSDIRDLFSMNFTTLNMSEGYKIVFKKDPSCAIPKRLIELYVKYVKPDYNSMIYSFKKKYISNEILVEKNDTKEQRQGLNLVYDYIQNYDFEQKPLDIFFSAMEIHKLLWKPTDDRNNADIVEERENKLKEIEMLKIRSKDKTSGLSSKERLLDYKKAVALEKELRSLTYKSKIGATLRSKNNEDHVQLQGLDIDIPSAKESLVFMNSYINPEKKEEFKRVLEQEDVIQYISYCVKEVCDMIYYQPFMDGNKRTFRSLLNLMFKAKGLPPVYIKTGERDDYKLALYKALKEKDYASIIGFYLFKICDSIYELDVVPYKNKRLEDYKKEPEYGTIGKTKR